LVVVGVRGEVQDVATSSLDVEEELDGVLLALAELERPAGAGALEAVALGGAGDRAPVGGDDVELGGVEVQRPLLDGHLGGEDEVLVAVLGLRDGPAVGALELARGRIGHVHGEGAAAVHAHDLDRVLLGGRVDGGQVGGRRDLVGGLLLGRLLLGGLLLGGRLLGGGLLRGLLIVGGRLLTGGGAPAAAGLLPAAAGEQPEASGDQQDQHEQQDEQAAQPPEPLDEVLLGRLAGTGRRGPAGAGVRAGRSLPVTGRSLPVARRGVVRGGSGTGVVGRRTLTVAGRRGRLAVPGSRGGLAVPGGRGRLAVPGGRGGLAVPGGRGRLLLARLGGPSLTLSHAAGGRAAPCGGAVPGTGLVVLRRRLRRLVGGLLRETGLEVRALVLGRLRGAALRGRLLARGLSHARGLLSRARDMGGVIARRARRITLRARRLLRRGGVPTMGLRPLGPLGILGGRHARSVRRRGRSVGVHGSVPARRRLLGLGLRCGEIGGVVARPGGGDPGGVVVTGRDLLLGGGLRLRRRIGGRLVVGHPEVPPLRSGPPGGVRLPAGGRAPVRVLDRPVRRRIEAVSH